MSESVWAIGLMSGTSLDGVDAALIKTDGKHIEERGAWLTLPYDEDFQDDLKHAVQQSGDMAAIAQELTIKHAEAVKALLDKANMNADEVDIIGFHGQTIDHRPNHGITWQIGNPALLSSMTGIDVVFDFRSKDMAEGGQGAPLVPLFHAAMAKDLPKPVAILNIGGIANVTWIDEDTNNPWILAFDTGPGNALINDLIYERTGQPYDADGMIAKAGTIDYTALEGYLYDTYFASPPPKSLDRYDFGLAPILHLSTQDAAATLTEFTALSILKAMDCFPTAPRQWLVAGGGRHNVALMDKLREKLDHIQTVESIGWEGDALEAQAFAYLAVRSKLGLPLTLPVITGARKPVSGGAFYAA